MKYVMVGSDGKINYVWITRTKPATGRLLTPFTDKGLILALEYNSAKDADRASSLLVKGLK